MIAYVQTATQTSAAHRRLFQAGPCCWPLERLLDGGRCELLLVDGDEKFCEPSEARAKGAGGERRGEAGPSSAGNVEAARVEGSRTAATGGRPRGPVRVFITFRTLRFWE